MPAFEFEKRFSGAAYGFFRTFNEYKARVAELPYNPFPYSLREAIEAIPGLIENRLRRWGWDFSVLTPEVFPRLCERFKADEEARERAIYEAAISWCDYGKNPVTHRGAKNAAFRAEQRDVEPTMPRKKGERAYHQRVEEWYMKPMIGQVRPDVTRDEHDQLCRAVTELERLARREWLPGIVTQENLYSKGEETVSGMASQPSQGEGKPAGSKARQTPDAGDGRPNALTLDDLPPTAWKLLKAIFEKRATDSASAVGRPEIAAKARVGNHDSKHNQYAFRQLTDLQLITAKRNVGTWITAAGIQALNKRSISG
jgi:hypothetical protein